MKHTPTTSDRLRATVELTAWQLTYIEALVRLELDRLGAAGVSERDAYRSSVETLQAKLHETELTVR